MTVKEKCLAMLTSKGMFDNQAEEVLEKAMPLIEVEGYKMNWEGSENTYPTGLYAAIGLILNREALAWIDANCPKAWYRPLFTDDPEAELDRLSKED